MTFLKELLILLKNNSNKGCIKLSFLWETYESMFLFPLGVELGDTTDLPFLKYCIRMGKYNHFGLNDAKSTDYIEKCLKQKLFKIKFSTKNSAEAYLYLSQYEARVSKDLSFPFLCIIFQKGQMFGAPLSPILGEIEFGIHWVFL